MKPISISIDRIIRKLFLSLLAIELLILLLDLTISHHAIGDWPVGLRKILNIAREDGIVTWFTSTLTFTIAAVLTVLYLFGRHRGETHARAWGFMGLFFLYTAIDDAVKLHERVGSAISVVAAQRNLESVTNPESVSLIASVLRFFPSYPWQVAFFPVFGTMGALILYTLAKKVKHHQARLLLGFGLFFLVFAVGLDFIEGLSSYGGFQTIFRAENEHLRHYLKATEETIEMVGFTCLLTGFISHLVREFPQWHLKFD